MKNALKVFAISDSSVTPVSMANLTPVGGAQSTGVPLPGLKAAGDYVVLAPTEDGILVHGLRGPSSAPRLLRSHESFRIDDLTLLVLPGGEIEKTSGELEGLHEILQQTAQPQNTERPSATVLKDILRLTHHEKGLVMTQGLSEDYEILVSHNIAASDQWISESLIQSVLKTRKPAFVNNLIGSHYQSSQSLIATGFLSIFCWPLIVQGEPVGVLLTGSRAPHPGLTVEALRSIETLVQLAAMISNFRRHELRLKQEIHLLKERRKAGPFQTQNPKLAATCDLAMQVAASDLALLIQGETGVGKEVMARWIHDSSPRRDKAFIAVNCGALPAELLESLLFGHKKGAFTNAYADQIGKFQQAHGGTIFLDEIGDLPYALQVKILRVLNDQVVEPLGSQKPIPVNVRLISASHKSLKTMMAQKLFREDLYYRIADLTLVIPPLSERPTDILLLSQQILQDSQKQLSREARQWLLQQSWPGNVRQLKSVLRRAAVLCQGSEILKTHFLDGLDEEVVESPNSETDWLGGENLEKAKQKFVRQKIRRALAMTEGHRTKAAGLLGITPRTLFRYLEEDSDLTDLS